MQEGMLFHALLSPDSSAYFEQTSYRLQGELQPEIVQKTLDELFKRHDILRTAFIHEGRDRPLQVVLKHRPADFTYKDISTVPNAAEKEKWINQFKEEDLKRSFDLTRDVLMRVALIRLNPLEYEFIWSHHHILMDGWCTGILIAEYFEIYNSYLEERDYRLPPVVPYSGYIKWLEKQNKEISRRYWRNSLMHYEEPSGIPKSKTHDPTSREYKNERLGLQLGKEESARLTRAAAAAGVTVNTIIQALWGIILGKYNGRRDVVFGEVVSGRPPEIYGVDRMMGLFINTVPIRINYQPGESFGELVNRVHENAIESEPHHYYPLADILSDHPLKQNLFDHILIFQNYPTTQYIQGQAVQAGKTGQMKMGFQPKVSNFNIFEHTSYDFNVNVNHAGQLGISIQYNANVYFKELVNKIGNHFINTLTRLGENMEISIETLNHMLIEDKRKEIMNQFNEDLEDCQA